MAEKKQDIVTRVQELKEEAKTYRAQFETKWREQERFYYGMHWKYNVQRPVKNHIFSIVETEIPILLDSMPGAAIIGNEQENEQDAEMLESSVKWTELQQDTILKDSQAVRSQLITGNGWQYVDYDHDDNGEGCCTIENLNWRLVYLDPAANNLDKANFAIIELPMRVADAQRKWPEKKNMIKPISDKSEFDNDIQEFLDPERWQPADASSDVSKSRYGGKDMTFMTMAYIRDYTMVKVPEELTQPEVLKEASEFIEGVNPDIGKYEDHQNHIIEHTAFKKEYAAQALQMAVEDLTEDDIKDLMNSGDEMVRLTLMVMDDHIEMHKVLLEKNPDTKMPKYENFWRLVVLNEDRLIEDGEPEVNDGLIPLVPFYDYKTEDSPYAVGEVRNLISPQKSYNEMDYSEYKGLKLVANPGWVIDEESGVDETTLTNEQGLIVKKKIGTEAKRLEAGQINPQLPGRKTNDFQEMQSISGINDATQGKSPNDDPSGVAIRRLQQQSNGRVRLKTRNMERYSIKRRTKLISSRNVKYWSTERKLRLYDNGGQIKFVDFNPERIRDLKYEVTIVPGSVSGVDKEQIYALMERLLTAGMIDQQMFFQAVDIPNKVEILKQLEEKNQEQAQIQELTQVAEQTGQQLEQSTKRVEELEKKLEIAPEIAQRDQIIEQLAAENEQLKGGGQMSEEEALMAQQQGLLNQ